MNNVKQPSAKAQNFVTFLAHFIGVCIIFILPEALMSRSNPHGGSASLLMFTKSFIYIAVFYLNYFIIIERCMNYKRWVVRIVLWNVLLVVITLVLLTLLRYIEPIRPEFPEGPHPESQADVFRDLSFISRDIVMIVLTIGMSVAVKMSIGWIQLRNRQKELESAQQRQELASLKSQLNPHFLFNTLNALYVLIASSPEKAQEAVHQLSGLLRYVLYENSSLVRLSDELRFIDNYVKLMKLRLGSNVELKVTLDSGGCENMQIAPLILISPVENAFKHGIQGEKSHIEISIKPEGSVLNCNIINSYTPTAHATTATSGIGAENLRKRLDLIYGDSAELAHEVTDTEYKVMMKIDLSKPVNIQ